MPSVQQHFDQAIYNYNFLGELSQQSLLRYDWMTIVQFYGILHLTKAHLSNENIPDATIDSHFKIETVLQSLQNTDAFLACSMGKDLQNNHIYYAKVYRGLRGYSERARYLTASNTTTRGTKAFHPIDSIAWVDAIKHTDLLLAHFLHHHPKISQAPFNALQTLPPIVFRLPVAPPWVSVSGLFAIN